MGNGVLLGSRKDKQSPEVAKVYAHNGNGDFLVGVRAATDSKRAGELDFPGGRREPGDASLEQTAVREVYQELGLMLLEIELGFVAVVKSCSASDPDNPNFVTYYEAQVEDEVEDKLCVDPGEFDEAFFMPELVILQNLEHEGQRRQFQHYLAQSVDLHYLLV